MHQPQSTKGNLLCFVALLLVATQAIAGERYLGVLVGNSSTAVDNTTTAVPFVIPKAAKVTVVCDGATYLITDDVASAVNGIPLSTSEKWPTSVKSNVVEGKVSVLGVSGAVNCKVYERSGTEL